MREKYKSERRPPVGAVPSLRHEHPYGSAAIRCPRAGSAVGALVVVVKQGRRRCRLRDAGTQAMADHWLYAPARQILSALPRIRRTRKDLWSGLQDETRNGSMCRRQRLEQYQGSAHPEGCLLRRPPQLRQIQHTLQ